MAAMLFPLTLPSPDALPAPPLNPTQKKRGDLAASP